MTCGGHFDGVQDIAWQPQTGHFLLSLSTDQTTRCHGYWKSEDQKEVQLESFCKCLQNKVISRRNKLGTNYLIVNKYVENENVIIFSLWFLCTGNALFILKLFI